LLKHFAWGPISDILKKREDKIANDLDSAEQSRRSWQCDVRKCHRCQRLIFDTTGSLEAFCLGTNQRYFEKT
ncbi:ATP synthase F0 subunit B, partial [Klebsiella pneumoniae]|nr:ATP synthase F0 subunit B [Klebsiella pneumoniae]